MLMMLLTTASAWATITGSGTEADPFLIASYNDLKTLRDNVNNGTNYNGMYFKQTANIDCLYDTWSEPIGKDSSHPFGGNYDGDNKTIKNFKFSSNTCKYAGLFGYVCGERVNGTLTLTSLKNIVLEDCDIQTTASSSCAAGISAGNPANGIAVRIDNCRVSGTISGVLSAGGIIMTSGTSVYVTNCFADVTVSANTKGKIYAYVGSEYGGNHILGNYYHDSGDGVGYSGDSFNLDASEIAPVYTVKGTGFTTAATNAVVTHGGKQYFLANATATITPPANTAFRTFTATGATYSLAADKQSASLTLGTSDATVTATLQTIGGSCGTSASWTLDQDGDGNYTRLTISGTGEMNDYTHITNGKDSYWRTSAAWGYDLTSVTIPDGITSIGDFAFCGCQQLSSITIGSSVQNIGYASVNHCDGLTTVELPASVNSIEYAAFENCVNLARVNIGKSDGVITAANAFNGCHANLIIAVPTPALTLQYKTATNWSGYASKLRAAFGSQVFNAIGTVSDAAYEIANADDLRHLATAVNQDHQGGNGLTFRQTDNITLTGAFTPIGYYNRSSDKQFFYGTYDGGEHTITGLSVSGDYLYAGLFGLVDAGGTVKNVRLISPIVTSSKSSARVAALIGQANQCTIDNCLIVSPTVSATTSSTNNMVGALVGYLDRATVQNCFVISPTVSAEGSTQKGAICGYAYSSSRNYYCTLTNVYYYDCSLDAIGWHSNSQLSKLTNVGRAHLITLGSGVTGVSPAATAPENGFVYDSKTYYREGAELTLGSTPPTGYHSTYKVGSNTLTDNTYTVNNGDVTFTAEYTNNTYTVKFNGNGNTGGSMADMNFTYDEPQNLTANAFTLTGYAFAGWATSTDGDVVYTDQQSVSNLTDTDGGTVTLYAKWVLPYIDADGYTRTCNNFTVLTSETNISNLGAGWYVVTEDVSYNSNLYCLTGDIHLILCDGAKMTVNCNTFNNAIQIYKGSLTIYAQSTGNKMGELIATASKSGWYGITAGSSVTICGGNITATGYYGIYANTGNITIHSGEVNATGSYYGIYSSTGNITIHSGEINATGNYGIRTYSGDITLGWTNATDYISANSYSAAGTVKIADGMSLHNGSEVLSGIISDMNKLDGKTLIGVDVLQDKAVNDIDALTGKQTNITLSGRTLYKDGYWNTLVLPFDVTIASSPLAGDNVVAKVLNKSSNLVGGTLTLNFDNAPATIPAGTPFIIKWDNTGVNLVNPVFTGVTIDKTTRDVDFTGGSFMGTYAPLEITEANRSKVLLLSGGNKLGYAKNDRTIANGKALGTCRAYFYFSDSQTARSFVMNFGDDDTQTTGIVHTEITEGLARRPAGESQSTEMAGAIYDLQGRHVEKAKKGLYIVNGKKKFVR